MLGLAVSRRQAAAHGTRAISCPHCGRTSSVAREAVSVPCGHCNRRIELEDLEVTENISRDLMTGASVLVRAEATVSGSIHAGDIIVLGTVKGDLLAGRIELASGSLVVGTIRADSVILRDGANVIGRVEVGPQRRR